MIRAALSSDYRAVMRLYHQLNPDDPAVDDAAGRTTFDQIIDDSTLTIFVLEVDHVIVATTYLNVIANLTRSMAPYAVVENVVVDEGLRGTGVGKRIMAATLDAAWNAGCYKAMLMTGSKSPSTLGFYQACGFNPDAKHAFLARPPRIARAAASIE